ncbi:NAD-binding protein [Bacillus salinus]|uniref:NAD-binding protein n=1 Tax=Bacillus sp. HMF5848 TaxID=2495421 RepID=UPI00163993C8|nr:NAD-binding protein [Bacillus sp. HMF5848]
MRRLFFVNVILIVLLAGGLWSVWWVDREPSFGLVVTLSIFLGITPLLLFVKRAFYLQVFLFTLAMLTGFYGFYFESIATEAGRYSGVNALYSTIRLFILDTDNVFAPTLGKHIHYPLSIEIARWSAAATTIATILQIAYRMLGQSIKLFGYKVLGNHYIIVGYNHKSKALINSLRKNGKRVIVISDDEDSIEEDFLHQLGVITILSARDKSLLFHKLALKRAKYFILLHEDDSQNLDEIVGLIDFLKNKTSKLEVILHLHHQQSYLLYEDIKRDFTVNHGAFPVPVRTVNVHSLMAEKLLNDHPLYKYYEDRVKDADSAPLHMLFVGFGQTGQQVAVQAIERAHFLPRERLQITVLDKEAERLKALWYRQYPRADKVATMRFRPFDVSTEALNAAVAEYNPTHVFICLQDDYADLMEGIDLCKQYPQLPIFIKMKAEAHISKWVHTNTFEYDRVFRFGYYEDVLNEDYFINETLTKLAKLVHTKYMELQEVQDDWLALSDLNRESNRNQMNHADTKLLLLELDKVKKNENHPDKLTKHEFLQYIEGKIEALAEIEHERWNAFHFMRSWDVKTDIAPPNSHKDEDKRLHGCLVSWDELDRVCEITRKPFKEYDRDTIRNLYDVYQFIGYDLVVKKSE